MISPRRKPSRASERLLPGQISYLKKRAECNEEELSRANISNGCFDHLVLILSTDTREAQAEALIVSRYLKTFIQKPFILISNDLLQLTSFGGKSLGERHPYNRRIRLFHLPIAPAPRHPDNNILLELDGDLRLPKDTYVKTELPYTIPWSMLRASYRDLQSRKVLELKPRSFAQLLQYIDARVSAEPELLRKRITSPSVSHRGSRCAQQPVAHDLASMLRNMLVVLLAIVVIYFILAELRSLWDKTTSWMIKIMVECLGSWSPL